MKDMKNKIAFYAFGTDEWIGGLYYIKNVAFELTLNKSFMDKNDIYIFTTNKYKEIYSGLPCRIITLKKKPNNFIQYWGLHIKYNIKYAFPGNGRLASLGVKRIMWIPDFQTCKLPEMFSKEDIEGRNLFYKSLVRRRDAVILSSEDCKSDFINLYGADEKLVCVLHFVSAIQNIVSNLDEKTESEVLQKYGLYNTKYAVIMNQFWQHKNHIIVLEAMKELFKNNNCEAFQFVFTGKVSDYRSPDYINRIKKMFKDKDIADHSLLLGFVNRVEQIILMKNSQFVIQPSLFEGWGTVVEDAKVLDKTILLSDIPVHNEQKSDKCILFDPYNSKQLANLIEKEMKKDHFDNVSNGVDDMVRRAEEYTIDFEQFIDNLKG